MANKLVESPLSILVVFISYWIVTLQELCVCFCFLLQRTSHHFLITTTSSKEAGYCRRCTPAKIINDNAAADATASSSTSKEQRTDTTTISSEDLGSIMGKLGIVWDQSGGEKKKNGSERLGLVEISNLFNELTDDQDQPIISIGEAREAFELFDGNKDGFIDAKELQKMLSALGFKETTESECQKMISVFDCNGDRLIDFPEFLKVLGDSFC